ncbi:hypothetical protein G3578_00680 [Brevibacillus sp. SYP-B805]|uniref:hypothetical protein n=1 Tax=Brevibacillus sp. SYP-B805 TaxID=1578199 RepID=UPI0013EA6A6B|nr:hypothetical protein [Brevibacillus sp. SYP-B805]NGQ93683.1 hypothetical protein [Brevibacillus sp. SYP-B805]
MVDLDTSISFLIYVTAVSSAAAGVTEACKSIIPFLATDYEPQEDCLEDHNLAGTLTNYKKFLNLLISVVSAGVIFGVLGLDPALLLIGEPHAYVEDPWNAGIWMWGIVAVFGSPFFHSVLKILEGLRQRMQLNQSPPKPKQKVSGRR